MALKQIMLRTKIEKRKKELSELISRDADFARREAELETAISEASTDEEETTVAEQVETFESDKKKHEETKTALETEIAGLEEELSSAEAEAPDRQGRGFQIPETRERRERMIPAMNKINIRSLPMNVRAFDTLSMETREQIVKRSDVKSFLDKLRSCKGSTRGITGAELEIPVVFLELISENMYRYSKLLNRVRVVPVPGEARQTIAGTVPEAVWTEMCGAINELSFVFNQVTLDGYKVAGFVPVCNSILEDTDIALATWIIEMISESIGKAEDKAIIYGKGAASHMPMGIVTRLAQTSQPESYPANAPAWVDLHQTNLIKIDGASMSNTEFWAAMAEAAGNTYNEYARGGMFWAMNSKTHGKLKAKLINFAASGDIVANLLGTLPIVTGDIDVLEFIPDNDIIGGYGNLYMWVDRASMVIDQSEHVQFIQDNTVFRGKARADGQPVIPQAFVGINIANASVTTAVNFAADTANDAALQALSIGTNSLSPVFSSGTLSYTVAEANADTAKVEATAVQPDASVEITYNGQNVRNGGTVTLQKDSTAHPLTVTVRKGNAVRVYTVNITRASG